MNSEDKPQEFGEINKYLESIGAEYPNHKKIRTGLSHTLIRMIKQNRIKKLTADKNHKYPRYISNSKTLFESAFDGYLFRNETIGSMFRNIGIDFES